MTVIFAKNLVRRVRPEIVCPFSAVHDISTAEVFIKQHGSSIVLKGSSAVLEFELQVFRDNAQEAMAEVRRGLRIGASLLIEKYIDGNEFTQYCFTDGFNSFFPKVVRDFPFRSATSHQKTGGMGSAEKRGRCLGRLEARASLHSYRNLPPTPAISRDRFGATTQEPAAKRRGA